MASAETGSARDGRVIAACLTATLAFWAYSQTLLPGVDLGDTGGFQAAVLWPETSARRAYPLYYALAGPFVSLLSAGNPARGLNLFSAVWAAASAGLLVWVAALITRSVLAGAAAGLLLAGSYTFWTQAVIAEVYSLHLALVAACLAALHAWSERPTLTRLAIVMALYAGSFGNHLSMILLFVPLLLFIVQVHPRPRELFRPPIVLLAVAIAFAGTLEYAGTFLSVWSAFDAPIDWRARVAAFWFDTTKADWRESMVLGVGGAQAADRLAMWAWDARQQFGLPALVLALAGCVRLWRRARPWAVLVVCAYAISTAFALTYNVGDPHVFFLPGHLLTALAAGAALMPLAPADGRLTARLSATAAVVVILYAGYRGWQTWPAVDRSGDRRAEAIVARIAQGLDDRRAILATRLDWQVENAVLYAARYPRRTLAWTRLGDVLAHFPFLVRDNHAIGRDVVLSADAAADVVAAFGPAFTLVREEPPTPTLAAIVDGLPRGTPYVLALVDPVNDPRIAPAALDGILRGLSGRTPAARDAASYHLWAGVTGDAPSYSRSSLRPFQEDVVLLGERLTVRLDAWLPFDTFRRGGFGHVLRNRERLLTIERGLSLAWLASSGAPAQAYAGGLYAPEPRFRIASGATLGLAALQRRAQPCDLLSSC